MESGLKDFNRRFVYRQYRVVVLVVMESGLKAFGSRWKYNCLKVVVLVVMESGLKDLEIRNHAQKTPES